MTARKNTFYHAHATRYVWQAEYNFTGKKYYNNAESDLISSGDGYDLLNLRSAQTGRWSVLLRCQAGSFFRRHRHLGAGEYFVVKGRMEYRMGTAVEGAYGYEPLEAIHDHTAFPEYTELYFTNYGAVAFLGENDEVIAILNHRSLLDIVEAAG